jgi:hypothetical protein
MRIDGSVNPKRLVLKLSVLEVNRNQHDLLEAGKINRPFTTHSVG